MSLPRTNKTASATINPSPALKPSDPVGAIRNQSLSTLATIDMFKSLFRMVSPSKPFVPPTQKQLDYAALCGIEVNPNMDRDAVSAAIDAAFAADPKLQYKISARRKKKQQARDALPAHVKRTIKKWEDAADNGDRFLVVYHSEKNVVVDVLECDRANVNAKSGAVTIRFLAPLVHDATVGFDGKKEIRQKELCWDRAVSISAGDIIESRKLQIHEDQVKKYQSTIKRKIEALSR